MPAPFSDLSGFRALLQGLPRPDAAAQAAARDRNAQLTKPPGALGRLEDLAIWLAGWQGREKPQAGAAQKTAPGSRLWRFFHVCLNGAQCAGRMESSARNAPQLGGSP